MAWCCFPLTWLSTWERFLQDTEVRDTPPRPWSKARHSSKTVMSEGTRLKFREEMSLCLFICQWTGTPNISSEHLSDFTLPIFGTQTQVFRWFWHSDTMKWNKIPEELHCCLLRLETEQCRNTWQGSILFHPSITFSLFSIAEKVSKFILKTEN